MDACLELLLPHMIKVVGLEQKRNTFAWDDISHYGGADSYQWGDFVELVQTPIPQHLPRYLPASYITADWIALSIRGEGLDLLQGEVNGMDTDWRERSLVCILQLMMSQCSEWALVFELHCDQIDSVYRLNIDDCLRRFQENLKWSSCTEGFVIVPPT